MASSEQRLTVEQIIQAHQAACREIACSTAAKGMGVCPFCPWKGKEKP